MTTENKRLDATFFVVIALITSLLVLLAAVQVMMFFYSVVVLLGVALIFTYILLGPVYWVEQAICKASDKIHSISSWKDVLSTSPEVNPRLLAVIVVYLGFFLTVSIASVKLAPLFFHQLQGFGRALPTYIVQAEEVVFDFSNEYLGTETLKNIFEAEIQDAESIEELPVGIETTKGSEEIEKITDLERSIIKDSVLKQSAEQLMKVIQKGMSTFFTNLFTLITGTFNGLLYVLTAMLLIFYFLLDGKNIRNQLVSMMPKANRGELAYFMDSFHEVMSAFIKGQVMLGILTGIYMFIVYSILDVKYAFFLGAFFAVSEILPVVGTYIGFTPGIIVMLFSGEPITVLYAYVCSYSFQTLKDNVLGPKIVGDVMGLHPVVVILSLVICAKLAGIMGILLALPLASFLQITLGFLFHRDKLKLTA